MAIHPHAGQPPREDELENLPRLVTAYYTAKPDLSVAAQKVSFGTSGHRGLSVEALSTGPHPGDHPGDLRFAPRKRRRWAALFGQGHARAFRAGVGHGAGGARRQRRGRNDRYRSWLHTHPALSHAILVYNAGRKSGFADGIVITPSHNPPADGGFKYNPPNGGPADTGVTGKIQDRANAILSDGLRPVRRIPYSRAIAATQRFDYVSSYVNDLGAVVDLDAVRSEGLSLAADALGGAGIAYWGRIAERYGLHNHGAGTIGRTRRSAS